MDKKRDTAIVGACGEHYIAAYLSGMQLIVGMPRAGVPGCDLLVANRSGGRPISLQVKTGTQSKRMTKKYGTWYDWPTSYSVVDSNDDQLWFAYVWLNGWPHSNNQPEVFFVPRRDVVAVLEQGKKEGKSRSFFWFPEDRAERYRGLEGLRPMLSELGVAPRPSPR